MSLNLLEEEAACLAAPQPEYNTFTTTQPQLLDWCDDLDDEDDFLQQTPPVDQVPIPSASLRKEQVVSGSLSSSCSLSSSNDSSSSNSSESCLKNHFSNKKMIQDCNLFGLSPPSESRLLQRRKLSLTKNRPRHTMNYSASISCCLEKCNRLQSASSVSKPESDSPAIVGPPSC